jgi:hypothetical protein
MKILLVLTFVYGVLRLFTYVKIFDHKLVGILESTLIMRQSSWYRGLVLWLDMLFFYFSLCYQAYYWIFK